MIKQYLVKQKKIARGVFYTYFKTKGHNYNAKEWFDKSFYIEGISDRQTISPRKSPISSKYHYCSVESQILKHFYNYSVEIKGSSILDIGSGSGHWIEFYKSLGTEKIYGIDVSESPIKYLKNKYSRDPNTVFYHGKAVEIIDKFNEQFDIVNAIGVMFHIVNDSEWYETIKKVGEVIPKNGIFIVGGHFGILNKLNVQIDKNGQINKRLRSKTLWKKTLKKAGFSNVKFYKNNAYLWIKDTLPENNIIVATK